MVEKEARGIALIGAINRGPGAQREGRRGGWLLRKPSSETLKCTPVVRFAGSHKFPLGAIPDSWDGVKRAGHFFRPGSVPAPACRIRRIPERIRFSRSLSPFVLAARRPAPRDGRLIRDDVLGAKMRRGKKQPPSRRRPPRLSR